MSEAPLILGAGPAGTAAAITLAAAGVRPRMIERTRETQDAICGGFLSWRTLETLARLGVEADALNPRRVTRVRVFANGRMAESRLPRAAIGVSRRRLDTVLLARAVAMGAGVERGVTARAVERDTVRTADGATLAGSALFLASGKHDVRGSARPAGASGRDPALGLRTRIAATPRLAALVDDAIELHLFDRGYLGLVLQEDGSANACMAVHRSRLHEAGDPARLLAALGEEAPALGERLRDMDPHAIDAIANVPYGWRAQATEANVFRLGDQAAVIPSLAGEGVGIALASGASAAHAFLADGAAGAQPWQHRFSRQAAAPVRIAGAVRALVEHPLGARVTLAAARVPALMQVVASATRIGRADA